MGQREKQREREEGMEIRHEVDSMISVARGSASINKWFLVPPMWLELDWTLEVPLCKRTKHALCPQRTCSLVRDPHAFYKAIKA